MEHFKLGEAVALNRLSTGTRGTVVSVTEDGHLVTVRWSIHFLQEGARPRTGLMTWCGSLVGHDRRARLSTRPRGVVVPLRGRIDLVRQAGPGACRAMRGVPSGEGRHAHPALRGPGALPGEQGEGDYRALDSAISHYERAGHRAHATNFAGANRRH